MEDRNLESQRIFRFHNLSSFTFGKKPSYFKGLHERQWDWFEVSQSIVLLFWVLYYIIYYILKTNKARSQSKIKTACSGKLEWEALAVSTWASHAAQEWVCSMKLLVLRTWHLYYTRFRGFCFTLTLVCSHGLNIRNCLEYISCASGAHLPVESNLKGIQFSRSETAQWYEPECGKWEQTGDSFQKCTWELNEHAEVDFPFFYLFKAKFQKRRHFFLRLFNSNRSTLSDRKLLGVLFASFI